jgi:hypothetical protein
MECALNVSAEKRKRRDLLGVREWRRVAPVGAVEKERKGG